MKKIIFATHNDNKVREIQDLVKDDYRIFSLDDIGFGEEIPENQKTIEENAMQKARYIYSLFHEDCFADDTGLEVSALSGSPGVYSARFAALTGEITGDENISQANIRKLLKLMDGVDNRQAQFRTIIALILDGEGHFFEGIVKGSITRVKRGSKGFGYDPVFLPDGFNQTFAQMTLQKKNRISHRAMAVNKLIEFLNDYAK